MDVKKCKFCGRRLLINPDDKSRRDRECCDSSCYQKYHRVKRGLCTMQYYTDRYILEKQKVLQELCCRPFSASEVEQMRYMTETQIDQITRTHINRTYGL